MIVQTSAEIPISKGLFYNYLCNLVNLFFKILPMREDEDPTLQSYLQGLQVELLGAKTLIVVLCDDPHYLSLLSILQYFIDNPDCEVHIVKREVFQAISICNKLKAKYASR